MTTVTLQSAVSMSLTPDLTANTIIAPNYIDAVTVFVPHDDSVHLDGDFYSIFQNVYGNVSSASFTVDGNAFSINGFDENELFDFGSNFGGPVHWLEVLQELLAGNDSVIGTAGADVLEGFDGDDLLIGNGGADQLKGG